MSELVDNSCQEGQEHIPAPERVSETVLAAPPRVSLVESRREPPSFWAPSAFERVESPSFWVVDLSLSRRSVSTILRVDVVRYHTRLNGTGNLVGSTRDVLSDLVGGGLLRIGSDLLLGLLAESLAPGTCQ